MGILKTGILDLKIGKNNFGIKDIRGCLKDILIQVLERPEKHGFKDYEPEVIWACEDKLIKEYQIDCGDEDDNRRAALEMLLDAVINL